LPGLVVSFFPGSTSHGPLLRLLTCGKLIFSCWEELLLDEEECHLLFCFDLSSRDVTSFGSLF
jgi:hypothetical protein